MADTKKLVDVKERAWSYNDIQYWVNPEDKTVNAIINFNEKLTRLRAGIIILKDDTILLGEETDEPGIFSLPGGGLEKGETPIDAAKREAQEEVYINVKNAHDTEYDYCECHTELKKWVKENVPKSKQWYNYYTCLVIAEYDSDYLGKVDTVDKDPIMNGSCRWYKIKDVINKPGFKKQWKKALVDYGYYTELKESLLEDTRTTLISKSRNVDQYKDQSRGINRFERKKYSQVAKTVKQYNTLDMNSFFKQDILTVTIPVTGETNNYEVNIKIEGVVAEMHKNIKSNNNKLEFRTVIQALTKIFNTTDLKVHCSCPDFKYSYQHNLIINNNNIEGTDKDPGPGTTGRTANMKGQGCKHVLLCLNNGDWLMKVASCIKNYIFYAEEHMQKAFMNIIFPKLYGMDAEQAQEENIIPHDDNLETDTHIIETINDWAKNKGKYKPGTNKNPAAGTKELDLEKVKQKPENQVKPVEKPEEDTEESKEIKK